LKVELKSYILTTKKKFNVNEFFFLYGLKELHHFLKKKTWFLVIFN